MDIASLGIRIDSSQVKTAAAELDKLAVAGEKSATSTSGAADAAARYTAQMNAVQQASRAAASAQVNFNAEQEKFISGLQRQVETAKLNKYSLLDFKAAELGVADQAKGLISQLQASDSEFKKTKAGIGGAADALGTFSLQSTIARRELLVMGRELSSGNTSRFASSFSLFAQSSGLLAVALSPIGAIIGGVAAAMGGLALAYAKGSAQSAAFANSLLLTGNYAGITEGQYNSLSESIAKSTGATIGSAREVTQALVSSGKFGSDAIKATATATELLSRISGESTDKIVKQFIGMADGVFNFASKANESYHFLTAAQLDYIRTLEDQGDKQKAMAVTMDALTARFGTAAVNLGVLERAWIGVKNAASLAIDAMLGIGRTTTSDDQIAAVQKRIANAQKPFDASAFGGNAEDRAQLPALKAQLAILQQQKATEEGINAASKTKIEHDEAQIAFSKLKEQSLSRQEKLTKELAIANALADKAGTSDADRQKVLDNINEKYKPPKVPKGPKPIDTSRQDDAAQAALEQARIKAAQDSEVHFYTNTQKVIEAMHAAGLIDDQEYANKKIMLIDRIDKAQQDGLAKELTRLQAETFSGKNANADRLRNAKQIVEVEAQIAKASDDAAVKGSVAQIQQQAETNKLTKAFLDARDAAQSYLDTIERSQSRDLAGFGAGSQERSRVAGLNQIQDRYDKQRRDLEKSKRDGQAINPNAYDPGTVGAKVYDEQLSLITEFQDKALKSYDAYYSAQLGKQGEWSLGAMEALRNYHDEAQNVYKQTADLFTDTMKSGEDALVSWATTGKISIGSVADSFIANVVRMQIKALEAQAASSLLGFFGGMVSGGAGAVSGVITGGSGLRIPGRAGGGSVSSGGTYLVGEKGPELLQMGSQSGHITPNGAIGGGAPSFSFTYNIPAGVTQGELLRAMQMTRAQTKADVLESTRRAGAFAR